MLLCHGGSFLVRFFDSSGFEKFDHICVMEIFVFLRNDFVVCSTETFHEN